MSILKAILYTVLWVVFWAIIQLILLFPCMYVEQLQDYFIYLFGIIKIVSAVGSFLLIYYFVWKPKPMFNFSKALDRKNYRPKIYFFLPLIAVGLFFVSKPLWDFKLIVNFYNGISIVERPFIEIDKADLFFEVISVLLVAPIIEELFYRKFLLEKLSKRYKSNVSLFVSSFCFSIIHIETPNNLVPVFIAGIVFGLIYLKTKKIGYSITLHFLFNLIVLASNKINFSNDNSFVGFNFNFTYWVLFVFGILLTYFGTRKIISEQIKY